MRYRMKPVSATLAKQSISKSWKMMPKNCRNKLKPTGLINPQNYNFNHLCKYLNNCGPLPDFLLEIFMQNGAILDNSNV